MIIWMSKTSDKQSPLVLRDKASSATFIEFVDSKSCSLAQRALAWVHKQGHDVLPIPVTKSSTTVRLPRLWAIDIHQI